VEITEVRIKLMEEAGERLQAFCSITFDDSFVIRDLKIIEGTNGPFVAMPSRKLTAHCPACGSKNHLRAAYCNQCGVRQKEDRTIKDEEGRAKLYADIAHPINSACREMIQERVIREFRTEIDRSKLPGYVSTYEDFDHEDTMVSAPVRGAPSRPAAEQTAPERPQVQPAELQPRGPHKTPVRQAAQRAPGTPHSQGPAHSPGASRDSFGAGIF
jgi:stage V sporulation protein G